MQKKNFGKQENNKDFILIQNYKNGLKFDYCVCNEIHL